MAVMDGCEGSAKTWQLEERTCPQCGEEIEVYTSRGRIVEDAVCEKCGYTIKAQEQVIPGAKKEED
ncbi:MAG TPA: hypothetical protein IAA57_06305 [Candidatus Pullilachnospira intestinigallinarum]|nr:hypothetical protein [Candidatus Pullilachnospira intestinigallinarum]